MASPFGRGYGSCRKCKQRKHYTPNRSLISMSCSAVMRNPVSWRVIAARRWAIYVPSGRKRCVGERRALPQTAARYNAVLFSEGGAQRMMIFSGVSKPRLI